MAERRILVVVEGEKKDFRLMERLFELYLKGECRQMVAYKTNIYELYGAMEREDDDWENLDFLQVLKKHEKDVDKKEL